MAQDTPTPKKGTSIAALRAANWDGIEEDVVNRIRSIRALVEGLEPSALNDQIANDLFLPALELLGKFCACITEEEEDDDEVREAICSCNNCGQPLADGERIVCNKCEALISRKDAP